jgi:hypothetical protein
VGERRQEITALICLIGSGSAGYADTINSASRFRVISRGPVPEDHQFFLYQSLIVIGPLRSVPPHIVPDAEKNSI